MSLGGESGTLNECFKENAVLKDDQEFIRWVRGKAFQAKGQIYRNKKKRNGKYDIY